MTQTNPSRLRYSGCIGDGFFCATPLTARSSKFVPGLSRNDEASISQQENQYTCIHETASASVPLSINAYIQTDLDLKLDYLLRGKK
jgi:hypothetical protein